MAVAPVEAARTDPDLPETVQSEPAVCGPVIGLLDVIAVALAVVIAGMLALHPAKLAATDPSQSSASAATAAVATAGQVAPINTLVSWRADTNGAEKTYLIGGLTLTLSYQAGAGGAVAPTLHVTTADGLQFDAMGKPGNAQASASIGWGVR